MTTTTNEPPATTDPDHRTSGIKRVRAQTIARVAAIARHEHRDWITQLDLVVDAGLRALGHPPLLPDPEPLPRPDPPNSPA